MRKILKESMRKKSFAENNIFPTAHFDDNLHDSLTMFSDLLTSAENCKKKKKNS